MGYSIEKEAEKVTNKQILQITLPFFNLGEQNRIFLFESQTNFMQLAIVFGGTLEVELPKVMVFHKMIKQLTIFSKIDLWIADDDA